jgi:hypothetical protein
MKPVIRYAEAAIHPLGHRLDASWSITIETLPAVYRVVLFRKRGSAVSDGDITAWFSAGTVPVDSRVYIYDSRYTDADVPTVANTFYIADSSIRTAHDFNCANGATYHYAIVAEDCTTHEKSITARVSGIPAFSAAINTFDVKHHLVLFLQQLLTDVGKMTLEKDVFIVEQFSNLEEHDPEVGVFRMASSEARKFIGGLRESGATADSLGSYTPEVFSVIWQSKSPAHVDALYMIFGACAELLKQAFGEAGASECYVNFGAESATQDADGVWGRRGRCTVVVEHDKNRVLVERIQGRGSITTEFAPADDSEA